MEPTIRSELWAGVDRLIDRAPSLRDLRAHRLHLLAARRWRQLGREVPTGLAIEELMAIERRAATSLALRRAQEAYDGRLVVLKGPSAAAYYPLSYLRPSTDLDILVDDPEAAQRALLSDGFEPSGEFCDSYYLGLQHLRPLRLPGPGGAVVELHRRPNWVEWVDPPSSGELLSAAVEVAAVEVDGIPGFLGLPPEHNALVVAAHSWGERPLRRILDLVDVAAVSADADPDALVSLARRWGLSRMWNTTFAAAEALLFERGQPWSLRIWARDLSAVRDRSVLEDHLRRWLSPFWALPPHRGIAGATVALARDATPAPTESWGNKLARVREAVIHPARSNTEHGRVLGPEGIQPRHNRR